MDRARIRQKKTGRPVRFELTDQTRQAADEYFRLTGRKAGQFLFTGRGDEGVLTATATAEGRSAAIRTPIGKRTPIPFPGISP